MENDKTGFFELNNSTLNSFQQVDVEVATLQSPEQPLPTMRPRFRLLHDNEKRNKRCFLVRKCGRCAFKSVLYTAGGLLILFLMFTVSLVYMNEATIDDLWNTYDRVLLQEHVELKTLIGLQDEYEALSAKVLVIETFLRSEFGDDFSKNLNSYTYLTESEVESQVEDVEETTEMLSQI